MPLLQNRRMDNRIKKITLVFYLLFFTISIGQVTQEEPIGTQNVTVVKSYTPSLSKAFKIRSAPVANDSMIKPTPPISYSILSVPMVSTFSPNKATPLKLQKQKQASQYNTLLAAGLGNQGQLHFDFSSVIKRSRRQSLGILLYRDGYFKNVKNSLLKSSRWEDFIGLNHAYKGKFYSVDTQLRLKSSRNNFFGVAPDQLEAVQQNTIDPLIIRNSFKFLNDWNWYKSVVKKLAFQANITTDNFATSEQYLQLTSHSRIGKKISINLSLEGLNTTFNNNYFSGEKQESQMAKLGTAFQWENLKNDFKYKLGVRLIYFLMENDNASPLYYFPKVNLSYNKPESGFTTYLNIGGDLTFNRYTTLAEENRYLAPSVALLPTHTKYNARLGVQTKAASVVFFDFSLGYDNRENVPLFQRLPLNPQADFAYRFSNAYGVKYIDLTQFDLIAKASIDFGNENSLQFSANYYKYQSNQNEPLWNLPSVVMDVSGQFKIADAFYFNFLTSFLGDRESTLWTNSTPSMPQTNRLPAFISSKINISYHLSKQWDIFLKAQLNNSDQHARWAYFPENNFLILAGLRFKLNLNL